ncbi:hypothetical protein P9112_004464 [Eukaryota sp. TZLM1-RC]
MSDTEDDDVSQMLSQLGLGAIKGRSKRTFHENVNHSFSSPPTNNPPQPNSTFDVDSLLNMWQQGNAVSSPSPSAPQTVSPSHPPRSNLATLLSQLSLEQEVESTPSEKVVDFPQSQVNQTAPELPNQLNHPRDSEVQTEELADPTEELEYIISDLKKEIEVLKNQNCSNDEQLRSEMRQQRSEIEGLERTVSNLTETKSSLQQEIDRLDSINADQSKEIDQLKSANQSLRKSVEVTDSQLNQINTSNQQLSKKETELASQNNELNLKINELTLKIDELNASYSSLENEKQSILMELDLSNKKIAFTEAQLNEALDTRNSLLSEINSLKLKNRELEGEYQLLAMNCRHLKTENMHLLSLGRSNVSYSPGPSPAMPLHNQTANQSTNDRSYDAVSNNSSLHQSQPKSNPVQNHSQSQPKSFEHMDHADRTYHQLMALHSSIPDSDPNKPPPPMSFEEFKKHRKNNNSKPFADESTINTPTDVEGLDNKLRDLQVKRDELEGTLKRLDSMAMTRVAKMRKKRQMEEELEELRKEISSIRLQLRKAGQV